MAPPNIRVRGIRTSLPSGYVLGRVSPGVGDTELIDLGTIAALVAQSGQVATPSSSSPPLTFVAPAAGLTITPSGSTITFALANDLAALEGLSTTGMAARTGTSTWATRTITGTTNRITLSNGTGVSGDPTIDIHTSYVGQASITTLGTISTGTWAGTTVAVDHGGTGQTSYTNGQLLIGNTSGNTLAKATITAGSNITVTNGASSITIAATGGAGGTGLWSQIMSATPTAASTGLSTWGQQNGATVNDAATGICITGSVVATDISIRYGTAPATPYTITVLIATESTDVANAFGAVFGWYDGTKIEVITLYNQAGGTQAQINVLDYATLTSAAAAANVRFSGTTKLTRAWFQAINDGTTATLKYLPEGNVANAVTLYSVAVASHYLSALTNICFGVARRGAGSIVTCESWTLT